MDRRSELYALLAQRGGFEMVRETVSATQLRVIGRVAQDRFAHWLGVVHQLLTGAARPDSGWSCDISKQYMLAPDGVRQGWRVIWQSPDMNAVAEDLLGVVGRTGKPEVRELESQLLPGYQDGQERSGVLPNGKGAAGIFQAAVGPRAVQRVRAGGQ